VILPPQRPLTNNAYNTHNRQTSTPPAGFEPAIPASGRRQTHALDSTAIGFGFNWNYISHYLKKWIMLAATAAPNSYLQPILFPVAIITLILLFPAAGRKATKGLDAYRDSNISESLNKHRAMSTLIFKV
jgi:hypothetical protein